MADHVKILSRSDYPTQAHLRRTFNQVDFGVFPAHAEGWNLEVLELMACGKPSIVTNYSGHTEFCKSSEEEGFNSILVEPNGMEKAQDGIWFHGQGDWCTFNIDDLADAMKRAHDIRQADVRGEYSGAYGRLAFGALKTAKEFSWGNTVEKIEEAL
jgi:glycosyltransferase involved in cell wall biosynthesis